MTQRIIAILSLTLLFPGGVLADQVSALTWLRSQLDQAGLVQGNPPLSDWVTIAVSAINSDPHTFGNPSIVAAIKDRPVSANVATELERRILALRAAGESADVEVSQLLALASGGQLGSPSLINDDDFGVLALRAAGSGDQAVRDSVQFIQRNQNADGGFSSFVGGASDVDSTGAALAALSAAGGSVEVINRGFDYLATQQNSDGGFGVKAGSGSNVDSTSWAIWAHQTAGRANAATSAWLAAQQRSDGSFGGAIDTAYALIALSGRALPIVGSFASGPPPAPPPPAPPPPASPPSDRPNPSAMTNTSTSVSVAGVGGTANANTSATSGSSRSVSSASTATRPTSSVVPPSPQSEAPPLVQSKSANGAPTRSSASLAASPPSVVLPNPDPAHQSSSAAVSEPRPESATTESPVARSSVADLIGRLLITLVVIGVLDLLVFLVGLGRWLTRRSVPAFRWGG